MDIRWFRIQGMVGLCTRLPLYEGKLDLLAIGRCYEIDPAKLSVRVILKDDEDDEEVAFHAVALDFKTGLSRLTLDELNEEVQLVHGRSLPDGKTQEDSLVFEGSRVQIIPDWLKSLLTGRYRGRVPVDSVICYKFMFAFRKYNGVEDPDNIANDKTVESLKTDYFPGEDEYVDCHIPPTADLMQLLQALTLPGSYRWLSPQEISNHQATFRVLGINLEVEVKSKSTAVLAFASGATDSVMGVDLVSDLTPGAVNRCEMEFYLWASKSSVPHLQLITDMRTGALAFYCRHSEAHSQEMACEAMSVNRLKEFLRFFVSTLPADRSELPWSLYARKRLQIESCEVHASTPSAECLKCDTCSSRLSSQPS